MKKDYTDIIIVLDRSGSMESVRNDTIGGFNQFVNDQKKVPGEARLTLTQFNQECEPVLDAVPIRDVANLNEELYKPGGSTALYDAIGLSVEKAGKRFGNLPEADRPEKVIFVIITDGFENASRSWTGARVKQAIQHQSEVYKWQFVYIGANQDAILNAASMGIAAANAVNYTHNAEGTHKVYGAMGQNVSAMRCGTKSDMSWEAKQREDQEEAAKIP